MQTLRDDPHRAAAGDSTRDVFAFGQGKRPPRTATSGRSDPTMTGQNEVNDYVVLTQGAANLIAVTGPPSNASTTRLSAPQKALFASVRS